MPLAFFSRNSSVIPGPIIAILCLRWHGNQRCFHSFNNRQLFVPLPALRMYRIYSTCTMNSSYQSVRTSSISHPIIFPLLINRCSYSRLVQSAMKRNKKMKNKNILLIDNNGTNLGVMSMDIALQMGEAQGMTLVQVAKETKDREGVFRMMTKKEIWENEKKERLLNKKDPRAITKDIKITTNISENDLMTKVNHVRQLLEKTHNVQVWIQPKLKYYQREIESLQKKERAKQSELLSMVVKQIKDVGAPLSQERWSARGDLVCILKSNL